jgi:hypothetical protein
VTADLAAMPLDELRRRRDELRRREEDISYLRRLLHAQLDIVEASLESRNDITAFEDLVAVALADGPPRPGGDVRAVSVEDAHDDVDLEPLPVDLLERSVESRNDLLDQLRSHEAEVSEERRQVLDELDALQDELVRRYRRDGVDTETLLGDS